MAYSEAFIKEVVEYLDNRIEEFFEKYKIKLQLESYTFSSFVAEVLENRFKNNIHYDDLLPLATKAIKAKHDKRKNMFNMYQSKYLSLPINAPEHPMHFANIMPADLYKEAYGLKTPEELVEEHIKECESWRAVTSNLLVAFPGISHMRLSVINDCLCLDITIGTWNYIQKELNGDIGAFSVYYPSELIDKPLFTPRSLKEKMNVSKEDPSMMENIIEGENGQFLLALYTEKNDNMFSNLKTLSADCKAVLSTIINSVGDLKEFSVDRRVSIPLRKLATSICDYTINNTHIKKVEAMIDYMFSVNIEYVNPENPLNRRLMHIVDNADYDGEGMNRWVDLRLGTELADDILQHRLIAVTAKSYKMLENPISKILCHCLKKEQLAVNSNPELDERKKNYDYAFFIRNVRFNSGNKKNNITLIRSSLDEFIEKGIIIEKYTMQGNTFVITFLPLSDAEIAEY